MADGEKKMISLTEVVKSMNEYKEISKSTLYRYIIALLELLDNHELFVLAFSNDTPDFIRRRAYMILMKRIKNINKNSLDHYNTVNKQ